MMKSTFPFMRGFSILEVLVAALIVVIGFGGALALLVNIMQNARLSKNEIIAANLAQEGSEIVRNIRDANVEAGEPYNDGLAHGRYAFDYTTTGSPSAQGRSCTDSDYRLKQNISAGGRYEHSLVGTDSPFFRCVEIADCTSGNCIKVTSRVKWYDPQKSDYRDVSVSGLLYDWQDWQ